MKSRLVTCEIEMTYQCDGTKSPLVLHEITMSLLDPDSRLCFLLSCVRKGDADTKIGISMFLPLSSDTLSNISKFSSV